MDRDIRDAIGDMTYHRRQHGLSAGEIYLLDQLSIKMKDFLEILDDLPAGILLDCGLVIALMTFHSMLMFMSVERHDIVGINGINRNRNIDSFTEEECWHYLRFRKPDVHRLYSITQFPQIIRCENGTVCQGEYAFCLMLYRIAYPVRLFSMQSIFARDVTQLSRIFQYAVTFMFDTHQHKVQGNMSFYSHRFDLYHRAVLRRVQISRHNNNEGFVPVELCDIFAFLDGTGLEIARPSNGAQNPFYNGYMHGRSLLDISRCLLPRRNDCHRGCICGVQERHIGLEREPHENQT
jgi:hypothetical protein